MGPNIFKKIAKMSLELLGLLLELLLELLLLLLYAFYHVLIRGREAPPYNPFEYSHTRVRGSRPRSACAWAAFRPCVAPCSHDWQKKMRSAVRLRSGLRFSAQLGSSGRSWDAPGTLRASIFESKTTGSSTFVASGMHASARLGSSGRSWDAPGTLPASISESKTAGSSMFVASGMHASARPPDPYETLRGRMNFKLRACCDRPNIGRILAPNAARRRVRPGNALDKGPEATQGGQPGARDG